MKLNELFDHQKLFERLLHSEFTIGFELEGICTSFSKYSNRTTVANELDTRFSKYISTNGGNFKSDGSLKPGGVAGYLFEWASPVYKFTPTTIQEMLDLLSNINNEGVYTNRSCGFHIHMGFPTMSDMDMIWIVSHLALDNEMIKNITKFKRYKFLNKSYASADFLDVLKNKIEALKDTNSENLERKIEKLKLSLGTYKFRTIRMHPQGTLEWRGPRNFLNNPETLIIKHFLLLLWKFVSWIISTMNKTEIVGIPKHEYLNYFSNHTIIDRSKKFNAIYNKIKENPKLINKITNKKLLLSLLQSSISQKDTMFLEYLEDQPEDVIIDLIHGLNRYYLNTDVQMAALKSTGTISKNVIKYLYELNGNELNFEMQRIIILKDPRNIEALCEVMTKPPYEEIQKYAVQKYKHAITYIENPSDAVVEIFKDTWRPNR